MIYMIHIMNKISLHDINVLVLHRLIIKTQRKQYFIYKTSILKLIFY